MTTCRACSIEFTHTVAEIELLQKLGFTPPLQCPDCRLQHRLLFRNERNLFRRKDSKAGQQIISIYHPESPYVVWQNKDWWSQEWDAENYGRDFDFTKPFFEQFESLRREVPRIALFNVNPYNSDYCQQAYDNKNCYLCFVVKDCEDSLYVTHSNNLTDCMDCGHLQHCELSYECLDSDKLYSCVLSQSCQNSSNLYFCFDCIGCHDCIGCIGLRNRKYCVKNEQLTEQSYKEHLASLQLNTRAGFVKAESVFEDFHFGSIQRQNLNINTEACVGNYLINAKNCHECFDGFELEDCQYCTWSFESKDCMDIYGMGTSEVTYQSVGVEKLQFCAFDTFVSHSAFAFYSDLSFYCKNIFGCVGMRNKEYAILNRCYSKPEYESLRAKVVAHMKETGEWGMFFPLPLSPFSYNESVAQDYMPLSRQEALSMRYLWREAPDTAPASTSAVVPDDLQACTPALCKELIPCAVCSKGYRIIEKELSAYKRMNIVPPNLCPDCRHMKRNGKRQPRKLWDRNCASCSKEILSSVPAMRKAQVYCQPCYLSKVVA